MKLFARISLFVVALLLLQAVVFAATVPDIENIKLVGHSDLNGAGKGGEAC